MKYYTKVVIFLLVLAFFPLSAQSEERASKDTRAPGPHIIKVDYDALYKMKEPPSYEPFEVYGWFLLSVAAQQTPLAINPHIAIPDHVVQTKDIIFKKVENQNIGVDICQPKKRG